MPGQALLVGLIAGFALGPVLAGWAGHGLQMIPVFAVLLLAGHLIEKRRDWPADAGGWAQGAVLARLGLTFGVQLLYAGALHAAGLGLGHLAGPLALPLWAPFAPTLAALAVSGAWWLGRPLPSAAESAELDAFLDEALQRLAAIEARARAEAGGAAGGAQPAPAATQEEPVPLEALLPGLPPRGISDTDLDAALEQALGTRPAQALGPALAALARQAGDDLALRACARLATGPARAGCGFGPAAPARVFEMIAEAGSAPALASWIAGAETLLRRAPQAWPELPEVARLVDIATDLGAEDEALSEALLRLANRAEDLAREEPGQP